MSAWTHRPMDTSGRGHIGEFEDIRLIRGAVWQNCPYFRSSLAVGWRNNLHARALELYSGRGLILSLACFPLLMWCVQATVIPDSIYVNICLALSLPRPPIPSPFPFCLSVWLYLFLTVRLSVCVSLCPVYRTFSVIFTAFSSSLKICILFCIVKSKTHSL